MYKIIGADKKEYGPVTEEILRRWLAEGRVNGQTPLQAEGTTEWKPLSSFPELAEGLNIAPTPSPFTPSNEPGLVPMESILMRDYTLDIGRCIARSWELVKANFWPVVGISLLVLLAIEAV